MQLRIFEGHSNWVSSVAFSPDGRAALSGSTDGSAGLWQLLTGNNVARFLAGTEGDWLAITPAGFFTSGDNNDRLLHIVRSLDVFSISQLIEKLYRPDLVQAVLNGDLEGKYADAASKLNLETIVESGPPPQIEGLVDKADRAGDTIRLAVRITGRGGGVGPRVVWRVNGVTQGNTTPSALAEIEGPLATIVISETLRLVSGQTNTVDVTAYNRAGLVASLPYSITVDKFGATTTARPRMFVLALGVNKYRMKDYQLAYAAFDASSFAKALTLVGSTLFAEVKPMVLTDEQVTEGRIASEVDVIAREAKPEDVFVLFIGGHGKSIAGRYYYYPQTLDFAAHQSVEQYAIGQDKWESWLGKITVQKSLLIVDTCEGDAFRGSRGIDAPHQTAMIQLQHATGRNVISATRDAAYEGYHGHGVLTYAVLEHLDIKGFSGGDREVGVRTLAAYVEKRVPQITMSLHGVAQLPTDKLYGNDFPIGIR
jgi:Caspase domain/WD domain, G-beta repeat